MRYTKERDEEGSLRICWEEDGKERCVVFERDGHCHNGDSGSLAGLPIEIQTSAVNGELTPTSLQNYLLRKGYACDPLPKKRRGFGRQI